MKHLIKTIFIDSRVLNMKERRKLIKIGFILVPDKWVTDNLTEYKIYVEA